LRNGLTGGVSPLAFDGGKIEYGLNRMDGPAGGFSDDDDDASTARNDFSNRIRDLLAGGGRVPGDLTRGGMPADAILARSEFLEPLSPKARESYNALLAEWSERGGRKR
jgi:hypothetical protein